MTSDPDQIRESIERTQQNLSADVDALTEKVSPPRIVQRRVQRTRSAMTSMKERIMGSPQGLASPGGAAGSAASSARDMASSAKDAASSAKDTVAAKAASVADMAGSAPDLARERTRGNPLAAGLIAFGAGWLIGSLLPATEPEQQAASQVKDVVTEKGGPVTEQLRQAGQETVQELRESAQQRAQSVRETATDAAAAVAGEAQAHAAEVSSHAQEAGARVTEQARPGGNG
jgi:cell division septum initiation protein DivIVA